MARLLMDSAANFNSSAGLRAMLVAAREYTLAIYAHLTPAQLQVPQVPTVNPPLWELAHIAWFQEFWCGRFRSGRAPLPSRYPHFDDWYNSSVIPHAARWLLPHPAREVVLRQMSETLDDTLEALEHADTVVQYFFKLAALHEAMHAEALLMTLQTLALPAPPLPPLSSPPEQVMRDESAITGAEVAARDVAYAGGTFLMGAQPGGSRFVFDNEKWAHPVSVRPFAMANGCVNNEDFARFVGDAGYARREHWDDPGWAWRTTATAGHPVYWRHDGTRWLARRNDRWEPLDAAQPVMHVNLHEARAFCAWAKRRLPTEAEWEFAARGSDGPADFPWGDDATLLRDCTLASRNGRPAPARTGNARLGPLVHMLGNVWEWTETPFDPYPGFAPDPYLDYSAPWFGNHSVLRGGSFATASWLIHNRFRNFYKPERGDTFAGFRTCALN